MAIIGGLGIINSDLDTCWAYASVSCVEALHFMATGKSVALFVQQVRDSLKVHKCSGGRASYAFQHMMLHGGLSTERDYPFTRGLDVCKYKPKAVSITGYGQVPQDDEDALKWALAYGPVVAVIEATEEFAINSSGLYSHQSRALYLNHSVLSLGMARAKR